MSLSVQQAQQTLKTQLSCQVCLIQYDSKDHRPLLLPACGHTFCAFCLQYLHQQGKKFCPKCRKDGAVQPVTSLPVNYSLLEIAQSIGEDFLDPESREDVVPSGPDPLRPSGTRTDPPSLPKPRFNRNLVKPRRHRSLMPGTIPSDPAIPAAMRRTMGAARHNTTLTTMEQDYLDELDFKMAVHLTFCKDHSHDLDLHTSCPIWCQENRQDQDLGAFYTSVE